MSTTSTRKYRICYVLEWMNLIQFGCNTKCSIILLKCLTWVPLLRQIKGKQTKSRIRGSRFEAFIFLFLGSLEYLLFCLTFLLFRFRVATPISKTTIKITGESPIFKRNERCRCNKLENHSLSLFMSV